MPQRVVTFWSCSLCPEETDSEEKIKHYTLSEGKRALVLDVCATCEASEPFATIVAAGLDERIGARTTRPATRATPVEHDGATVECQYCGEWFTPMGMGLHQSKAHGVKAKTTIEVERRGKTGKFVCDCGYRTVNQQGLGAHRRATHGVKADGTPAKPIGGEYPCPDCDFVTTHSPALAQHVKTKHATKKRAAIGRHPCPDCDFIGASPQGLGAHRRHVHPDLPRLGHDRRPKAG